MEQRTYYGTIQPAELAEALLDEWDRDDMQAQALQGEDQIIVQIGQREGGWFSDEPRQALTLGIEAIQDGVRVSMGQQRWYTEQNIQIIGGGLIGFFPFFFAWPLGNLFGGSEDTIDQSLPGRVWRSIERYTATAGAMTGETRRLTLRPCPECGVANPPDAQFCSACGAPQATERTCPHCGQYNPVGANFCIHCGTRLMAPTGIAG